MILIHPFWQSCPTSLTGTTAVAGSTAAANDPRSPYYGYYDYGWSAWIITAAELGGAKQISGIGIIHSSYTLPYTYANQVVKMGHVVQSQFPSATPAIDLSDLTVTDLKTVRSLHNFTLPSGSNNSWYKHTFDSNFCYNGTSNLIIVWENRSGNNDYVTVGTQQQVVGATQSAYKHQDVTYPTGNATGVRNTKPNTLIYS
jgi:hypothetical protein